MGTWDTGKATFTCENCGSIRMSVRPLATLRLTPAKSTGARFAVLLFTRQTAREIIPSGGW